MKASVIIPTYNGQNKIEQTLSALTRQSVNNFETVVVIDGSTDDTFSVVKKFESQLTRLQIVVQPNQGRSAARNRGASAANCEILLFIDDDIEVLPDNIERHLQFHDKNRNSVLVGSPRLNGERIGTDPFLNFRADAERLWEKFQSPGMRTVSFDNLTFTTQNLSLSKDLLTAMGRFDESLSDSEDFDLCVKLLKNQNAIFFDPTLHCYHNEFANLNQIIRRQSQYYQSKLDLLKLHPDYLALLPAQFAWLNKTYKDRLKRFFFGWRSPWEFFFASQFFSKLPASFRNASFSALIYTHSVLKAKSSYHQAAR